MLKTCFLKYRYFWAALGLSFFLAILGLTTAIGLTEEAAGLPANLGNQPEKIAALQKTVDPANFVFAVMGDVKQGTATFKHLLRIAQEDNVDFVIVLGDFVSDPEPVRHRHFAAEIAQADLDFPVLLAPGNHDMDIEGPISIKEFAEIYGSGQFDFVLGDEQFVVLNNVPPYDASGEYLEFLSRAVKKHAGTVNDVFVFMHVPVAGLNPLIKARSLEGSEAFMALCQRLKVRYVFMGDHHGYVKTVRGPTTYIVTGGGGDRLRGERGRFHHMTRIAVIDNQLTETVIATQKHPEVIQRIERNLAIHLWPLIRTNALSTAITGIIALAALCALFDCLRRFRKDLKNSKTKSAPATV